MYEIRPESIKTFIEDNNIRLPRFQRKQTWDEKKNFKLCISIFKEFPIGVSILSIEKEGGVVTRWLLDGRQRRNALVKMSEDPENIYLWAKKFIGFKESMQPQQVEDAFWEKINEYLEEEELTDDENEHGNGNLTSDNTMQIVNEVETENDDTNTANATDLTLLKNIILLVHNKTKRYSGFSRPFDLEKLIDKLPYVDYVNGKAQLNSKKIKSFIINYKAHCKDEAIDYTEKDSFMSYLSSRFTLGDKEKAVRLEVSKNWGKINDRILLIDRIDTLLFNAKIGLIEVKNINTTDGQKIFNIINSEGTKLTAVEILSAKPSWTQKIKSPSVELQNESVKLYEVIQIKSEDVVKWDVPATLLSRLKDFSFIFKDLDNTKTTEFEKKLTLGFKLISGLFLGGVKKENINNLSQAPINWETDIDALVYNLNLYVKLIADMNYFRFFNSWRTSIVDILSDAIALNFTILTYKDWERKGRPVGSNIAAKQFQKNCFILFDRLVYEYVTRQWRGSSDAKIAQNIAQFGSQNELLTPIDTSKWQALLKEVFERNTIDDNEVKMKTLEPLLYHFYCIKNIAGPDSSVYTIEVDHILPQSVFEASTLANKTAIQNNLFNLALLPKRDNISKKNKKLVEINDAWLKEQIKKYELIDEKDFAKYSDLNNYMDLKNLRSTTFIKAFTEDRATLLAN